MVLEILVKTPVSPMSSEGISSARAASAPSRTEKAITLPAVRVRAVPIPVMIWRVALPILLIKILRLIVSIVACFAENR